MQLRDFQQYDEMNVQFWRARAFFNGQALFGRHTVTSHSLLISTTLDWYDHFMNILFIFQCISKADAFDIRTCMELCDSDAYQRDVYLSADADQMMLDIQRAAPYIVTGGPFRWVWLLYANEAVTSLYEETNRALDKRFQTLITFLFIDRFSIWKVHRIRLVGLRRSNAFNI